MKLKCYPLSRFGKRAAFKDRIPKGREIGIPSLWCAFGGFLHKALAFWKRHSLPGDPGKTKCICE